MHVPLRGNGEAGAVPGGPRREVRDVAAGDLYSISIGIAPCTTYDLGETAASVFFVKRRKRVRLKFSW